jgi:hypothetical protein
VLVEDEPAPLASLAPALDADVAMIVTKAIARDPAQRYAGVAALLDDLRRWLAGEPILARPPTATYLLRTFVRRHRSWVIVAAGAARARVGGAAVAVRYGVLAERESRRADARTDEALAAAYRAATHAGFRDLEPARPPPRRRPSIRPARCGAGVAPCPVARDAARVQRVGDARDRLLATDPAAQATSRCAARPRWSCSIAERP